MTAKRIIVSGASGYVGRFIVEGLLEAGHQVLILGRKAPRPDFFSKPVLFQSMSLSQTDYDPSVFSGCDGFVHAAFHHVPGKYRGGEGDDPDAFMHLNHDGSMQLFNAVKAACVPRAIFLSSRAVYGTQEPGVNLHETQEPKPDTLYGEVKLRTERALEDLAGENFLPIILRATGVYGPAKRPLKHKWTELFHDFDNGKEIAPRVGTEVYGEDLANAVGLLLDASADDIRRAASEEIAPIFNVSDILLDRRELWETYADVKQLSKDYLPVRANADHYNAMDCTRLKSLGWKPRGKLDFSWI
ncbi:MAG: NAD(P)-dependent oxidoreductase [Rhizobiaceae bacterium]|nr:NAD(P)-dependent oxidoreductase [Rhizobiaceae bacterium]